MLNQLPQKLTNAEFFDVTAFPSLSGYVANLSHIRSKIRSLICSERRKKTLNTVTFALDLEERSDEIFGDEYISRLESDSKPV